MLQCTKIYLIFLFALFKWFNINECIENSKFLARFGRHYETPLLIQSVLMNMAMFALVHLCVNINAREVIIKMEERVFTGMQSLSSSTYCKREVVLLACGKVSRSITGQFLVVVMFLLRRCKFMA